MPPDMHETRPAVLWIGANVSKNAQDDSETFLYDPETDAYLGFVRLDKSTDHQVFWDAKPEVASLDDPRVAGITPLDPADIAKILGKASTATTNAERLSFAQLANAEIAYRLLVEALTPQRWVSSDQWDAAANVGTPAEVKPADDKQPEDGDRATIDALLVELEKRDETIERLRAENVILHLQIDERDHKIKRQAATIARLDAQMAAGREHVRRQDARVSELARTVFEVRTAVAS